MQNNNFMDIFIKYYLKHLFFIQNFLKKLSSC
jgi:hypothetical protein